MSPTKVIKLRRLVAGLGGPAGRPEAVSEDSLEENHKEKVNKKETGHLLMLQSRIDQLERELQEAREQSYNLGFQDGLAAESEQHRQKLEAHAQQFRELGERLQEEFDQALARMEEPLLRMSFRISEKILTAPLPESFRNEALVGHIQSFLKEVLHEGRVIVHVAPENLAFVQSEEMSEKLQQSFPGRIRFVADESLGPGECLVETPEHIIDGRYANQLKILESKLR